MKDHSIFEVVNLRVAVDGREIVKGVSLSLGKGEIRVIVGPNGSGKSTFASAIMGFKKYTVSGKIFLNGKDITKKAADERARAGLFLAFQSPVEIDGVRNSSLMRQALLARGINEEINSFKTRFEESLSRCGLGTEFYNRYTNNGFSGGEKKKNELAQMLMLAPKVAILDELDSGMDIDSLHSMLKIIKDESKKGMSFIFITHNLYTARMLLPTKVYIFSDGRVEREGSVRILNSLEKKGFSVK